LKTAQLHITNGNCYAAYPAARVPENCSRAAPFVQFSSTTFGAGVNTSYCPITCPKRQLPRTLSASFVSQHIENFIQ